MSIFFFLLGLSLTWFGFNYASKNEGMKGEVVCFIAMTTSIALFIASTHY